MKVYILYINKSKVYNPNKAYIKSIGNCTTKDVVPKWTYKQEI